MLIGRLRAHGVPCGEVRNIGEALDDPQLEARQMVLDIPHAELGRIRTLGNPIKLSKTPAVTNNPPPGLGEHTEQVLGGLRPKR